MSKSPREHSNLKRKLNTGSQLSCKKIYENNPFFKTHWNHKNLLKNHFHYVNVLHLACATNEKPWRSEDLEDQIAVLVLETTWCMIWFILLFIVYHTKQRRNKSKSKCLKIQIVYLISLSSLDQSRSPAGLGVNPENIKSKTHSGTVHKSRNIMFASTPTT